jgi:hypothetical protein
VCCSLIGHNLLYRAWTDRGLVHIVLMLIDKCTCKYCVHTDKWHNYGLTQTNDKPVLSSERAPHIDRTVTFKNK